MIAVYRAVKKDPKHMREMFWIEVDDDNFADFLAKISKMYYPPPTSEVLFIENDVVVNTFFF